MLAQYTAAALVSENKVLSHPAGVDNVSTCADVEDHVSMGATATRQAREVLGNAETVIAAELLCAAQGIDFRRRALGRQARMGAGTAAAYERLRQAVPFRDHDAELAPAIEQVRKLVAGGELVDAAGSAAT
jgi:histidine ammonia-lyase